MGPDHPWSTRNTFGGVLEVQQMGHLKIQELVPQVMVKGLERVPDAPRACTVGIAICLVTVFWKKED